MRLQSISILHPRTWSGSYRVKVTQWLARAFPGVPLSLRAGDTDRACVDTIPMGAESVVSRIVEGE